MLRELDPRDRTIVHLVWSVREAQGPDPGPARRQPEILAHAGAAMRLAAKYVGGVQNPRVHVGSGSGLLPLQPVARARQQAALKLVREDLFSPRAFDFPPRLLNKLAMERFPDWRDFRSMQRRFDYPVHARVLALQKGVLDRLLHPVVLGRVLDAEAIEMAAGIAYKGARPLDNADLSYAWRKRMARVEVARALRELAGLPTGDIPAI